MCCEYEFKETIDRVLRSGLANGFSNRIPKKKKKWNICEMKPKHLNQTSIVFIVFYFITLFRKLLHTIICSVYPIINNFPYITDHYAHAK